MNGEVPSFFVYQQRVSRVDAVYPLKVDEFTIFLKEGFS
jgi:hypothetical protein